MLYKCNMVVFAIVTLVLSANCRHARVELMPRPNTNVALTSPYWEQPFLALSVSGSYNSIIRKSTGQYEIWNNTVDDGPDDGLLRFISPDLRYWSASEVCVPHAMIDDVFAADGTLSEKRRYTRPSVLHHADFGYAAVAHVCDGYPPRDGSVYPAWLTSPTGKPGSWRYHGRLKGEIAEFLPGKSRRWADGRGLIYQPNAVPNESDPLSHRFLFFSNQYPGKGCLALLYSDDGQTWAFYRRDGQIVNLLPEALRSKNMIFPHVIKVGRHGWMAWLSEEWPPKAIWRIHSANGLDWQLFGKQQPELLNPPDELVKTMSAWYDEARDELHGFAAVWEGENRNYRLYHSISKQWVPED